MFSLVCEIATIVSYQGLCFVLLSLLHLPSMFHYLRLELIGILPALVRVFQNKIMHSCQGRSIGDAPKFWVSVLHVICY